MRRSGPPARRTRLRARPKPPADPELTALFHAAIAGKRCAKCGRPPGDPSVRIRAHHVLRRQVVERLAPVALREVMAWDPANAIALCDDCHMSHHHVEKLPLRSIIRDAPGAILFAQRLGPEAVATLGRDYA